MHYKIVHDQDVFELNPGLKAIEKYAKLTSRQMAFVMLVADLDWDNPLRTLPEKDRRTRAAKIVGFPPDTDGRELDKNGREMVNGKVKTVEEAIAEYRLNQFDEDKANYDSVNHQINEARELMALDKLKHCQVTEKTLDRNGNVKEKKFIDLKLAYDLADKAIKLGKGLTELMKTRKELETILRDKAPVSVEIETQTSADLPGEVFDQVPGEGKSTIDAYMESQKQ